MHTYISSHILEVGAVIQRSWQHILV